MPDGFESAYVYARVCGSLARSYLGDKAGVLAGSARVGEAWRAVFGEAPPALPEGELADAAERRLRSRTAEALRAIAGSLIDEEPFFAALLRKREYAYLKRLLSAIVEGEREPPGLESPGFESGFNVGAYPELDPMLRRSRFDWVIGTGLADLPAVKNQLDRQYYSELWASLEGVDGWRAGSLRDILRLEAELENIDWALRLKRYYSMAAEEIAPLLISLPGVDVTQIALDALRRKADLRSEWVSWKWERLVPDSRREDGGDWYFDLRGFESASRRFLHRRLMIRLHMEPDSYVPLYAYYRIKEFEAEAIQGIIEGIKLEAPSSEIASFAVGATGGRS
jgi:hypothetical protein